MTMNRMDAIDRISWGAIVVGLIAVAYVLAFCNAPRSHDKVDLEHALKALEFTKDWNTWIVGLETALIAAIMLALGKPNESALRFDSRGRLLVAIGLFLVSIFAASFSLTGIASIAQRLGRV